MTVTTAASIKQRMAAQHGKKYWPEPTAQLAAPCWQRILRNQKQSTLPCGTSAARDGRSAPGGRAAGCLKPQTVATTGRKSLPPTARGCRKSHTEESRLRLRLLRRTLSTP